VLARKTFRCRAWDLGAALGWAVERAAAEGFSGWPWRARRPGRALRGIEPP
jgi:hypothetical protein